MSAQEYRRIIAVDFDGTLAKTRFPEIIKPIPKTIKYCKRRQKDGAILILYTCRKGKDLQDAVEWCKGQGLIFDYVNENTAENIANYGGVDTRKIFAHEYIDDKAINPIRERMWAHRVQRALQQNCTGKGKREHGKGKQYRIMSFLRAERHCRGRRGNDRPAVRGSRNNAVRM